MFLATAKHAYQEALQYYQKSLVVNPNNVHALSACANLLHTRLVHVILYRPSSRGLQSRPDEAQQMFEKCIALAPDNTEIVANYAAFLVQRPDVDQVRGLASSCSCGHDFSSGHATEGRDSAQDGVKQESHHNAPSLGVLQAALCVAFATNDAPPSLLAHARLTLP